MDCECLAGGGGQTLKRPILWVLHTAYGFLPAGLALSAAQNLGAPIPFWVPPHVLAIGALSLMTLGMMTRVSLGHTGRSIVANKATALAYGLLIGAVIARSAGPFLGNPGWQIALLVAVALWGLAFMLFIANYAAILVLPRADGKSG